MNAPNDDGLVVVILRMFVIPSLLLLADLLLVCFPEEKSSSLTRELNAHLLVTKRSLPSH